MFTFIALVVAFLAGWILPPRPAAVEEFRQDVIALVKAWAKEARIKIASYFS